MAKRKLARIPTPDMAFAEGQAYAVFRVLQGLSHVDLAESTGLNRSTFANLESGAPSSDRTKRLARERLGLTENTVQRMAAAIAGALLIDTKTEAGPLSADFSAGMSYLGIAQVLTQVGVQPGGTRMEPITEDELRDLLNRRFAARQQGKTPPDPTRRGGLQPRKDTPKGG